jgi:2-polyprenyl-3-methyl-5-hydroxy-6-metoxy-1,4-benzoquinol methylase
MKNLECCVCNTLDHSKFYKNVEGYDLLRCSNCTLIYLSKVHVENQSFISDTKNGAIEYWSIPKLFYKHRKVFEFYFNQRLSRLLTFKPPSGPLLDVGFGYGFWANFLQERDYDVHGIEISKEAFDYSNQHFSIFSELVSFEDFKTEQKFAAIFMFDVLEHFEKPELMLKKAYSMLLPGGVIYIQVPNVIGFRFPYGHNLGLPHHIWQFSPKTLKKLTKKNGFSSRRRLWTGIQGLTSIYEKGGPTFFTKMLWCTANTLKIGNRVQILCQKSA